MDLYNKIVQILKERNMLMQDLAIKIGMKSVCNLGTSLRGNPRLVLIERICTALDIQPWELFYDEEEAEEQPAESGNLFEQTNDDNTGETLHKRLVGSIGVVCPHCGGKVLAEISL